MFKSSSYSPRTTVFMPATALRALKGGQKHPQTIAFHNVEPVAGSESMWRPIYIQISALRLARNLS